MLDYNMYTGEQIIIDIDWTNIVWGVLLTTSRNLYSLMNMEYEELLFSLFLSFGIAAGILVAGWITLSLTFY